MIDLDSTKNTSRFDPLDLWKTAGTVRDPTTTPDTDADNDGLFQRFTGSCGPTTLQMMLAEADPITAFAIHDDAGGVASDATTGSAARFQSEMLDGEALGRKESLLRARVHNALGRMRAKGDVSQSDVRALDRYLFAAGPASAGAERALAKLRAAHAFPNDDDVKRLRARPLLKSDSGMTTEALLADLNAAVSSLIGARYRSVEFGRGGAKQHVDDVARALQKGFDVPFGVAEPPHWLLLTAVRGKKPERELLVSDPDSGSTVWVTEKSFARGAFVAEQLQIERPGDRPYVDTLLLPERDR